MYNRNQRFFVARICKLAGLYPVQLLPEDENLRKLYTIYYHVLVVLFFICLMSFFAAVFRLLHAETVIVDEILKSFSLATPLVLTSFRQGIIRRSPDVRKMLKNAGIVEQRVYEENDPEVVRLFEKAGQVSLLYYLYYAVSIVFLGLVCMLEPMLDNEQVFSGNATTSFRKMAIPLWFPFDMQAHYRAISMDVLFFYFMRSPAIQLEILHHYLKRFDYYTGRMSVEPGNVASNIMMRKCIDMHRKVIKFVDIFNENFRNIMVLDFVQSSVRIASLSAVIIMNESDSVISFGFSLIHFWMALVREYYIYYAGNEITFLSSELVLSVYETDWYKENRQFKFMVKMFMILQGSFSYFSLVTGIQKS
ncbi:hypothetical protein HUJ04_003355 [Dendroctonus ponderosae]|nr:hypothetical protein HUJ04_003355 [Dendroctonus ponderosae]